MKTLYALFRWFAEFDLAIAMTSGNHVWIAQAREDLEHWQGECDRLSIQRLTS